MDAHARSPRSEPFMPPSARGWRGPVRATLQGWLPWTRCRSPTNVAAVFQADPAIASTRATCEPVRKTGSASWWKPRRAGGNRYSRVELADTCPELFDALNIGFESGVGIGLICGNPGDRVVALSPAPGLLGEGTERSGFASRVRCNVSAVYPLAERPQQNRPQYSFSFCLTAGNPALQRSCDDNGLRIKRGTACAVPPEVPQATTRTLTASAPCPPRGSRHCSG